MDTDDSTTLTIDDLRDGDVLRWRPADRHCREGIAVVQTRSGGTLYAADTFWGSTMGPYILRPDEIATATVEWNLADYRPFDPNTQTLADYAPP